MHIVIDCQSLQTNNLYRGIGRYIFNLITKIIELNNKHQITLLFNTSISLEVVDKLVDLLPIVGYKFEFWAPCDNICPLFVENKDSIVKSIAILNEKLIFLKCNYYIITSMFDSLGCEVLVLPPHSSSLYKQSVIVYDLIPLYFKDEYLRGEALRSVYMNYLDLLSNYHAIYTISESTELDLLKFTNVKSNHIFNISTGATDLNKLDSSDAVLVFNRFLEENKLVKHQYIFNCSSFDYRKNQKILIKAYYDLPASIRINYNLVLAGGTNYLNYDEIAKLISGYKEKIGSVVILNNPSDSLLANLYRYSCLFVFPSMAEGFGIPILEAASFDVPILASRIPSLSEVLANDGQLFNPNDVNELSQKIQLILKDPSVRFNFIQNGSKRLAKFTWEKSSLSFLSSFDAY